jgi:hypothetical protein
VLIDGKGGPGYDDLFTRSWLSAKDEPEKVRDHLLAVHGLMKARQDTVRTALGVKNVWHVGPSPSWPLVLVVMDEAHTFLNESKGTDPESKRLDGIARQTVRLVEELVRKGRNVGIQVVLATQKPTGDAIPTRIRTTARCPCPSRSEPARRPSRSSAPISPSTRTSTHAGWWTRRTWGWRRWSRRAGPGSPWSAPRTCPTR